MWTYIKEIKQNPLLKKRLLSLSMKNNIRYEDTGKL